MLKFVLYFSREPTVKLVIISTDIRLNRRKYEKFKNRFVFIDPRQNNLLQSGAARRF